MKHKGTITIETDRLLLRRFKMSDAQKMYDNWASDKEVTKYLTWHLDSVDNTNNFLAELISQYNNYDKYEWCIILKENEEPIGMIGAPRVSDKAELVEVAYCIGKSYWHQGITSEALKAVMDFFFDEVGVNRVEARYNKKNVYSGEVMKKCGMSYEGTRIQADCDNSGIFDCCMYGKVKKEEQTENKEKTIIKSEDKPKKTKNIISDETIEYVGILAKLELSDEEKEKAKEDIGNMLDYIDMLNELDTDDVEPMSHVFPVNNVFREDIVVNGDDSEAMLSNAPAKKDGSFKVPKTVD